ncbi:MAG: 50S ribosomal protein L23 [Saprospiraceae bacterium]|nr:50S ribosomal protein L23 [Saprospiraceae bacterium]
MNKQIIIRPVVTEKSETLSTKKNQYTFLVARDSNKIVISKAIEKMYSVSVESVNTALYPGKLKTRNTRNGVLKGKKASYKKAFVSLKAGDEINIFGDEK